MSFYIEIYNRTESTLLETLAAGITGELKGISRTDQVNGRQELELDVVYKNVNPANIGFNNIVRLVDSGGSDPYTTYRIKAVNKASQGALRTVKIKCEHLKCDLVETIIDSTLRYTNRTMGDIFSGILAYAGSWSAGSVSNSGDVIELFEIPAGTTVYDAIKQLATDRGLEAVYHADGTSAGHDSDWKKIDILTVNNSVNGTPGTCVFQDGVNIKSLSREQDIRDNFYTRLYAFGGDQSKGVRTYGSDGNVMTTKNSLFVIKSVSSPWITLYSKNLLIANDAMNNYYVRILHAGSWYGPFRVTDSDKSSSGDRVAITGAGIPAVAEGDIIIPTYDAANSLPFIPSGQSESTYGAVASKYENNEFEDFVNHLGPHGRSDFSGSYSGGVCQGWNKLGSPTCSESTSSAYVIHGTKSQKVVALADGDGLYREFTPVASAGEQYSVSFKIRLALTAIDADTHLHMRVKYGEESYWPPGQIKVKENDGNVRLFGETFASPRTYAVQGGNVEHVAGQTPRFEIYAEGGGATFYIDSIELVYLPYMPMPSVFVPYDSRVFLWEAAVKNAKSNLVLNQDYSIDVLDQYEVDRTANAAKQFMAGDTVTVEHEGLAISDSVRVAEKTTPNLLKAGTCRVKIESVDKGMAAKVDTLSGKLKTANRALAKNSDKANANNRANMAGFYSVIEEDIDGNQLRVGKYVDSGLINGTWINEERRLSWNPER